MGAPGPSCQKWPPGGAPRLSAKITPSLYKNDSQIGHQGTILAHVANIAHQEALPKQSAQISHQGTHPKNDNQIYHQGKFLNRAATISHQGVVLKHDTQPLPGAPLSQFPKIGHQGVFPEQVAKNQPLTAFPKYNAQISLQEALLGHGGESVE